jgi:HK97 family phage major capsid protein
VTWVAVLLGYRVIVDNSMPTMATGRNPISFGAVSEAFIVRSTDVRLELSRHAGWNTDATSFRAVQWLDPKVVGATALRTVLMA